MLTIIRILEVVFERLFHFVILYSFFLHEPTWLYGQAVVLTGLSSLSAYYYSRISQCLPQTSPVII